MRFSIRKSSRADLHLYWAMGILFVISLALRLLFVNATLRANTTAGVWDINRDTRSYRHLAHNLRDTGRYAKDDEASRYTALIRPPLYPLLLVGLEPSDGLPNVVLWVQAVIGAAVPAGVAWLAWVFYQERWAVWAAGLVATVSPTGVAICAVALPDLLFAALFIGGVAGAIFAIRNGGGAQADRLRCCGSGRFVVRRGCPD